MLLLINCCQWPNFPFEPPVRTIRTCQVRFLWPVSSWGSEPTKVHPHHGTCIFLKQPLPANENLNLYWLCWGSSAPIMFILLVKENVRNVFLMEFVAHHLFICSVMVNLGLECGREVFMSRLRKRLTFAFSFGHCPNYLLKCRLSLVSILGLRTQIKVMAYLISLLQNMLFFYNQNRQIQHKSI